MGKSSALTWALVLLDVLLLLFGSLQRQQRQQDETGAVGWTALEVVIWVAIGLTTFAMVCLWSANSLLEEAP